jgi:hypothetical protein
LHLPSKRPSDVIDRPIELDSRSGLAVECEYVALEAQERENDVGQGEECERQSGQFAEETTLRDTSCTGLGLLVVPLKTRQSQPINSGSSHFLASAKSVRRSRRKTDANAPKVYFVG